MRHAVGFVYSSFVDRADGCEIAGAELRDRKAKPAESHGGRGRWRKKTGATVSRIARYYVPSQFWGDLDPAPRPDDEDDGPDDVRSDLRLLWDQFWHSDSHGVQGVAGRMLAAAVFALFTIFVGVFFDPYGMETVDTRYQLFTIGEMAWTLFIIVWAVVMFADPEAKELSWYRAIPVGLAVANLVSMVGLKVQHGVWDRFLFLALIVHFLGCAGLIVGIKLRKRQVVANACKAMGIAYLLAGVNNVAWGFMSGSQPAVVVLTLFSAVVVATIMASAMWMLGPRILEVWDDESEPSHPTMANFA